MRRPRLILPVLVCLTLPPAALAAGKTAEERPRGELVGVAETIRIEPDLSLAVPTTRGSRWTHTLEVEDAAFLRPRFSNVNLRAGDVLVVRSATGRVVEEITGRGPKDRGSFWGLSAFGSRLTLQFDFRSPYATPPFTISSVIVGDPAMLAAVAGTTPEYAGENTGWPWDSPESICSPEDFDDVACFDGDPGKWANVLASVGVATASTGAGALWCSGSNVSPQNYVMTNYHCIGSQAECDDAEFIFKYYRTGCNDGSPPTGDWVAFRCDQLVASSPDGPCDATLTTLDFSLSSVIGDPASTFGFVTPDPTRLTDGEDIYIIQHPSGRPHEITHGGGADVDVDDNPSLSTIRYYDTLDTEPGSSGSPIYREADDLLVGLHHCGGCSTPGTGNRGMLMSDIYPIIQEFLCTETVSLSGAAPQDLIELAGNGDAVIDPGETWGFVPVLRNGSCTTAATAVAADVQANAASVAVTVLDPSTTFGDIAAGSTAPGTAVAFQVDAQIACDGDVILDLVNVTATNGGPFDDLLAYVSGEIGSVPVDVLLFEDFGGGIPGTWTIVDGGTGTGPAQTWTTANPGGRSILDAPFAIADSDEHGSGLDMDEELITAPIDVTGSTSVTLQLAHDFNWYSGGQNEQADIDVRSTATGGTWTNVASFSGGDTSGMVSVDLTPYQAADLQLRFHYYDATWEYWWAIDDLYVLGDEGRVCAVVGELFLDGFESGDTTMWSVAFP